MLFHLMEAIQPLTEMFGSDVDHLSYPLSVCELWVFIPQGILFYRILMLAQDQLSPWQVIGVDPDFGRESWNVTDAGVQVVADHFTTDLFLHERLLPDMGLKRIGGRCQSY